MIIGCLGDIVFTVSSEKIETFTKFKRTSAASFQSHARHLDKPLLEYTGQEADNISFNMRLSAYLGVNPLEEISKLEEHKASGDALPLIIGNRAFGTKWVIKNYSETAEAHDRTGNATIIDVNISLMEYAR